MADMSSLPQIQMEDDYAKVLVHTSLKTNFIVGLGLTWNAGRCKKEVENVHFELFPEMGRVTCKVFEMEDRFRWGGVLTMKDMVKEGGSTEAFVELISSIKKRRNRTVVKNESGEVSKEPAVDKKVQESSKVLRKKQKVGVVKEGIGEEEEGGEEDEGGEEEEGGEGEDKIVSNGVDDSEDSHETYSIDIPFLARSDSMDNKVEVESERGKGKVEESKVEESSTDEEDGEESDEDETEGEGEGEGEQNSHSIIPFQKTGKGGSPNGGNGVEFKENQKEELKEELKKDLKEESKEKPKKKRGKKQEKQSTVKEIPASVGKVVGNGTGKTGTRKSDNDEVDNLESTPTKSGQESLKKSKKMETKGTETGVPGSVGTSKSVAKRKKLHTETPKTKRSMN